MNTLAKPLSTETTAYQKELPTLIQRYGVGKFALYVGALCIGAFSNYREALVEGYAHSKEGKFLVRQISASEEIVCVVSPVEER